MSNYLELCTEEQLLDFYAEFDATKDSVRRDVQYLMEWIETQPHLPNITNEEWLANFLLRCKNSVEKAKKRLDSYFTAKAMYPQIFQDRNLSELIANLSVFTFVPMPKLTPDGYRVIICRFNEHKASDIPPGETIIKGMQVIFDYSLLVDKVRGLTLVYDGQNISMPLVSTMVQTVNKLILVQNKINPVRYNKMYFMNLPSYGYPLISIACSIIKKETDKFVIWRKECSQLAGEIPKECLPEEYGGTECSLDELKDLFQKHLVRYQRQFTELDRMFADLAKKPKSCQLKEIHGVHGSFRKLTVD